MPTIDAPKTLSVQSEPAAEKASNKAAALAADPAAEPAANAIRLQSMEDLIALCDAQRDVALKLSLSRYLRPAGFGDKQIALGLTPEAPKDLIPDLTRKLFEWTGERWQLRLDPDADAPTLEEKAMMEKDAEFREAENHPLVRAVKQHFPGAAIVDIQKREPAK